MMVRTDNGHFRHSLRECVCPVRYVRSGGLGRHHRTLSVLSGMSALSGAQSDDGRDDLNPNDATLIVEIPLEADGTLICQADALALKINIQPADHLGQHWPQLAFKSLTSLCVDEVCITVGRCERPHIRTARAQAKRLNAGFVGVSDHLRGDGCRVGATCWRRPIIDLVALVRAGLLRTLCHQGIRR